MSLLSSISIQQIAANSLVSSQLLQYNLRPLTVLDIIFTKITLNIKGQVTYAFQKHFTQKKKKENKMSVKIKFLSLLHLLTSALFQNSRVI